MSFTSYFNNLPDPLSYFAELTCIRVTWKEHTNMLPAVDHGEASTNHFHFSSGILKKILQAQLNAIFPVSETTTRFQLKGKIYICT